MRTLKLWASSFALVYPLWCSPLRVLLLVLPGSIWLRWKGQSKSNNPACILRLPLFLFLDIYVCNVLSFIVTHTKQSVCSICYFLKFPFQAIWAPETCYCGDKRYVLLVILESSLKRWNLASNGGTLVECLSSCRHRQNKLQCLTISSFCWLVHCLKVRPRV